MNKPTKTLSLEVFLILLVLFFGSCSEDENDNYVELKSFLESKEIVAKGFHSESVKALKRFHQRPYSGFDITSSFNFTGNSFSLIAQYDDCRLYQDDQSFKFFQIWGEQPEQIELSNITSVSRARTEVEDYKGELKKLFQLKLFFRNEKINLSQFEPAPTFPTCADEFENAKSINSTRETELDSLFILFDNESELDLYFQELSKYF